MADIVSIQGKRTFTLGEARSLIPVLRRLTRRAKQRYDELHRVLRLTAADPPAILAAEEEIAQVVHAWYEDVQRLGGIGQLIWSVDFDNGRGCYCWTYPEPDIRHRHGYGTSSHLAGPRRRV